MKAAGARRWITCTPVAFSGGEDFFARDSGLLCRGLRACGVECRAVMPGPGQPGDLEELVRVEAACLRSEAWWREQGVDGVVLYAWGRPKFLGVARAIRRAGIFLVLNQDNGGLVSPRIDWRGWWEEQGILGGGGRATWVKRLKGLSWGWVSDWLRAKHLAQGDVIACVSPVAAERYRALGDAGLGPGGIERVRVVPHAVEDRVAYVEVERRREVVTVGRWNDEVQKRPGLLMEVAGRLLEEDERVVVRIAGSGIERFRDWHDGLEEGVRERVKLEGVMDRTALTELLQRAWVFYSPSAFESFGIAAAEALCAGCTVVAQRSISMASFEWFVEDGDGRLVEGGEAEAHVRGLREELAAWKAGARRPREIAARWGERLHASRVAAGILRLRDERGSR